MIKSERKYITPDIAEEFLHYNESNRGIVKTSLAKIKQDMLSGKFKENGDSIRFSESGRLIDGQHRLTASVESGCSFWTTVVTGVAEDATRTIDTGKSRSSADVLSMNTDLSSTEAAAIASAIKYIIPHDKNLSWWVNALNSSKAISNDDVFSWYLSNKTEMDESFMWIKENQKNGNLLLPKSAILALKFLSSRSDINVSDSFFEKVFVGIGLKKDETEWVCREVLSQNKNSSRKISQYKLIAMVAKCFNATKKGRVITTKAGASFKPTSNNVPFFY